MALPSRADAATVGVGNCVSVSCVPGAPRAPAFAMVMGRKGLGAVFD